MYTNFCSHHYTKFYFSNSQLQRFLYYQKVYNNPFSLLILWYLHPFHRVLLMPWFGRLLAEPAAGLAGRELMWHQVQANCPHAMWQQLPALDKPCCSCRQHVGRGEILGTQWLLPSPVQTPHSLAERTPRNAALCQLHHTQGVLHSLTASLAITSSLCASTAAQHLHSGPGSSAALQLGVSLAIISLQLLKASENDPKRPPFSVRAKGSWWNHRGNTIFSVSTLAHGTSCHRVIPGRAVWQAHGVCSAQFSTSSRERSRNKCHPLDNSCLFFSYFGVILREKYLENELPGKMMLWSLWNQRYRVRTHFSDCPSRMCLQRGVCTVSLQKWCIRSSRK